MRTITSVINKNAIKNNYNNEYNIFFRHSKSKLDIYNYGNKNDRLKLKKRDSHLAFIIHFYFLFAYKTKRAKPSQRTI